MLELLDVSWNLVITLVILGLICLGVDIVVDISKK
jgi:hypothetical protein